MDADLIFCFATLYLLVYVGLDLKSKSDLRKYHYYNI